MNLQKDHIQIWNVAKRDVIIGQSEKLLAAVTSAKMNRSSVILHRSAL